MVFVDTGDWIAVAEPTDAYHDVAKPHYERLLMRRIPLFTSRQCIRLRGCGRFAMTIKRVSVCFVRASYR